MFVDYFVLVGLSCFLVTLIVLIYCLFLNKNLSRWGNSHFLSFALILSTLFLSSFLVYGQYSIENYNVATLGGKTIADHLLKGQVLTWFDGRAFGAPFPLTPSLDKHPLILVAHFFGNRIFHALFYLLHLTIGAFFFLLICKRLKFSPRLILLSGFLYIFSTLNVMEILDNDFPSIFLSTSMIPLFFFLVLDITRYTQNKRVVFALPVLLAFLIYNGHPTAYIKYFPFLLMFFIWSLWYTRREVNLGNIVIVLVLSTFIVLPRIYHIQHELSYFPDGLPHASDGYHLAAAKGIMNNLVPFWGMLPSPQFNLIPAVMGSYSVLELVELTLRNFSLHSSRTPFIGLPYLVISLLASICIFRGPTNDYLSGVGRLILISFILTMIMMHTPSNWYLDLIHPWTLRDLFIFFGILSGGLAVKMFGVKLPNTLQWVIPVVLSLQLVQHIGYVGNNVYFKAGDPRQVGGKKLANFLSGPEEDSPLLKWLESNREAYGDRILLSPSIERDLINEATQLEKEGFYVPADIQYYTGINVINEHYLKGISLDPIQPQTFYTQGKVLIRNDYSLIKRNELLDISSVDWVLIKDSEFQREKPFPGLLPVDKFSFDWKDEQWIVLNNSLVWNRAYLLNRDILDVTIEKKYCEQKSLFCNDLIKVGQHKIHTTVNRIGTNGNYELSLDPQKKKTILGISTMYRPEWVASSRGAKLKTFPLFDGFIGIEVPESIDKINLSYADNIRQKLMILSFLTFLFCILKIFWNPTVRYTALLKKFNKQKH